MERKCCSYWSVTYPICQSVCVSVWKVYCCKTADCICVLFAVVSGVSGGMGVLDGAPCASRGGEVSGVFHSHGFEWHIFGHKCIWFPAWKVDSIIIWNVCSLTFQRSCQFQVKLGFTRNLWKCNSHFIQNHPSSSRFPGFPRLLESPEIFIGKFPGSGKSWKMTLVLESPGNLLARS